MALRHVDGFNRFARTKMITQVLAGCMTNDQYDDFWEYLSNSDVTCGSDGTTVLLDVSKFKSIVHDFVMSDNKRFDCTFLYL